MDTIALIDAARMWRSPEHRDLAEIRLDELLCGGRRAGDSHDAIEEISISEHDEFDPPLALLTVTLSSGVVVNVPCNF